VHPGGIVRRTPHPLAPDVPLAGGPQMVELGRDGRRGCFTTSLYGGWDDQSIPTAPAPGWPGSTSTRVVACAWTSGFFPRIESRGRCVHQGRRQGGDASSDSHRRSHTGVWDTSVRPAPHTSRMPGASFPHLAPTRRCDGSSCRGCSCAPEAAIEMRVSFRPERGAWYLALVDSAILAC
jgi:hypothetical protein